MKFSVVAYDLFGNKFETEPDQLVFRPSVYGFLQDNDNLLVQRHPKLNVFFLPGGAIEKGETIQEALIREFQEETGLVVRPTKLLTVLDDFWKTPGALYQSVLLFYSVEKISGEVAYTGNGDDVAEAKWLPIAEISPKNSHRLLLKALAEIDLSIQNKNG